MKTVESKNPNNKVHLAQVQRSYGRENQLQFFSGNSIQTKSFFNSADSNTTIQPKLTVGEPGDKYEVEADAMADRVVQKLQRKENNKTPFFSIENTNIQAKCDTCEAEEVQRKEEEVSEEPIQTKLQTHYVIQAKGEGIDADTGLEQQLNSSKGAGRAMSDGTRSAMESSFGADFSGVRIHTGNNSVQMNQDLNAQAFTHGSDVYFNQGKYKPETTTGRHLLAHELTHVVQQQPRTVFFQRQAQGEGSTCRQPESNSPEITGVIGELDRGIGRMNRYEQNPELLVGQQNQTAYDNMRGHITAVIALAREFKGALRSDSLSICVLTNPCGGADACFVPVEEQFRLKPQILNPTSRAGVASFLHEYKHFKQHRAHAQNVALNPQAIIHTDIDELGYEYEAGLVGAIFFGARISQAPAGGSGQEMFEIASPRENLEFATRHEEGSLPASLAQLPTLSRAYRDQIGRNSPIIHYPVLWRPDNTLMLRNRGGNRVRLGSMAFSRPDIEASIAVVSAFWETSEAQRYEQSNSRRGVLVVYRGETVIKEIHIFSRPRPANRQIETEPMEERPIRGL